MYISRSYIFYIKITGTNSSDMCLCNCNMKNQTYEEVIEELQEIVASLTVDKKQTSLYKRKLNSASDDRASSRYIGYLGVVFITAVLCGIVLLDAPKLLFSFRSTCVHDKLNEECAR